jgi:hypothetical protein
MRWLLPIFLTLSLFQPTSASWANEYACDNFKVNISDNGIWEPSSDKDLRFLIIWTFEDPNNCVTGIDYVSGNRYDFEKLKEKYGSRKFPATWTIQRDGTQVIIVAEVDIPVNWLLARPNDSSKSGELLRTFEDLTIDNVLTTKTGKGSRWFGSSISVAELWGYWFSKEQKLYSSECKPKDSQNAYWATDPLSAKFDYSILSYGLQPEIQFDISNGSDCIILIRTGDLTYSKHPTTYQFSGYLNEKPYWTMVGKNYFNDLVNGKVPVLQVGLGDFIEKFGAQNPLFQNSPLTGFEMKREPKVVPTNTTLMRQSERVKLNLKLDLNGLDIKSESSVGIYVGYYYLFSSGTNYSSGGWRVYSSGSNRWTATYFKGGMTAAGRRIDFSREYIKIPITDLLVSPEAKAAAELKAKQEAEAKTAAELKAKQEAEANAAAELKAKLEAEAKAALATKKTTITCVKGKLVKKVTGVKPKCPVGYKVKK